MVLTMCYRHSPIVLFLKNIISIQNIKFHYGMYILTHCVLCLFPTPSLSSLLFLQSPIPSSFLPTCCHGTCVLFPFLSTSSHLMASYLVSWLKTTLTFPYLHTYKHSKLRTSYVTEHVIFVCVWVTSFNILLFISNSVYAISFCFTAE